VFENLQDEEEYPMENPEEVQSEADVTNETPQQEHYDTETEMNWDWAYGVTTQSVEDQPSTESANSLNSSQEPAEENSGDSWTNNIMKIMPTVPLFAILSILSMVGQKTWKYILVASIFLYLGSTGVTGVNAKIETAASIYLVSSTRGTPASHDHSTAVDSAATIGVSLDTNFIPGTIKHQQTNIRVADGKIVTSTMKGSKLIESYSEGNLCSVVVHDVCYIPGASHNLISVPRLDRRGMKTIQHGGKSVTYDKEGDLVISATLHNLYDVDAPPQNVSVADAKHTGKSEIQLWHERLNHRSEAYIRKAVPNLPKNVHLEPCDTCAEATMDKKGFSKSGESHERADRPGEHVAVDTCEMPVPAITGERYFALVVCIYSRFTHILTMRSTREFVPLFTRLLAHFWNMFQRYPAYLRCDQGTEFDNSKMGDLCSEKGIEMTTSTTQSSNQNPHAERHIRTVVNSTRAVLTHAKLGKGYWKLAARHTVYVGNRTPSSSLKGKTPAEVWRSGRTKVKSDNDLRYVRIFGCAAYARLPNSHIRDKLSPRGIKCMYLGFDPIRRGYVLERLDNGKIIVSRDVVFNENIFPKRFSERNTTTPIKVQTHTPDNHNNTPILEPVEERESDTEEEELRRSTRDWAPSSTLLRNIADANMTAIIPLTPLDDPDQRRMAMKGPHAKFWVQAEHEELGALGDRQTAAVVMTPKGINLISCRWVYKYKLKDDNTIDRFKARLVARGYMQKYGLDYEETFAPVALMKSFRTLYAHAVSHRWKVWSLDVNNAFLYSPLDKPVYMRHPPGYPGPPGTCLKLKKSLYGLKNAGRDWSEHFRKEIVRILDFAPTLSDPCVFTLGHDLFLSVHVDDILLYVGNDAKGEQVIKKLCATFEMKKPELLKLYLGFNIEHDQQTGNSRVNQSSYIRRMLARFNMMDANPAPTPAPPKHVWSKNQNPGVAAEKPYRALIGSLLYSARGTRPDTSQAVTSLARFNEDPSLEHWTGAKRILRYLKGTMDKGLLFTADSSAPGTAVIGIFSDASWADDKITRKSTTGVVITVNGTPVAWISKLQTSHAMSSCESELVAFCEAVKEALWLGNFLSELGVNFDSPIQINVDNQSAIALAKDPVSNSRAKHIDLRYKFMCQHVRQGTVKPVYVPTGDNIADVFTKSTTPTVFRRLVTKLVN
jgi:hypothetical protein